MKRSRIARLLSAAALIVAFAFAAAAVPQQAFAGEIYTAATTPSYHNPITGLIEDAGGDAHAELGQSMTESVAYPYALVEYDDAGAAFVTIRIQMATHISGEAFAYDSSWSGAFTATPATLMQQSGDTADFRFQVDNADYLPAIRVQMYVADMGRDVVFFITLDGLSAGNSRGFVESVSTGDAGASGASQPANAAVAESEGAAAPTATAPSATPTPSARPAAGVHANKTSPAAAAPKPATPGVSVTDGTEATSGGIAEFDVNGNSVGLFAGAPTFTVPQAIAIAFAVVAGVAAVGAAIYLVGVRPRKRALADAAFAAATLGGGEVGTSEAAASTSVDKTTRLLGFTSAPSGAEKGLDR